MLICRWDGTAADRIHVTHVGSRERYSFQEHSHCDYFELVYVRHGILEHEIEGAWQRQSAGTATLLRSGERHALRGERVEYINVSFDSRFFKRLDPDLKAALATQGPMVVHLPAARRTLFEADAETLAAATNPALRAVLLMQALCAVAATRLAHMHQQPQCGPPWLARLRERLDDLSLPVPDLDRLRHLAGVSAEHLARSVRLHVGCTPVRWLHQVRVRRGARLLAASDMPVGDIATCCGYPDPGLFHRHFTAVHGCGPRAYRRREQRFVSG